MTWKDVGASVAKAAPLLGAVLGGPAGAAAGAAGDLLASALGVEAEPEAVLKAAADPQTAIRLRELELQHQERLAQWRTDQLRFELENVQGARGREVELAKAGQGGAWITAGVAGIVTVGFFVMLWATIDLERVNEPALLLLGSLGTAFGAVVNYYLGSSLGSTQKNTLLANRSKEDA